MSATPLGHFHHSYYLTATVQQAPRPFILLDARIEINGTNLSSVFRKTTVQATAVEADITPMGALWRSRKTTLLDWSMQFDGLQDYTSADSVLWAALGTAITCKLRPTSAAITATNPEYAGPAVVTGYTAGEASVGELAAIMLAVKGSAPLVRSVT